MDQDFVTKIKYLALLVLTVVFQLQMAQHCILQSSLNGFNMPPVFERNTLLINSLYQLL